MEIKKSKTSAVPGHAADKYQLPEPEYDNCTSATWAYLNGVIDVEQAMIIDSDGMQDR